MFVHVYFAKKMSATETGQRLKAVVCEECGAQYFYQLRRSFTASRDAPYYMGQAGAAQKAQEAARKGLEKRLFHETEMVPCPTCNWVNQDLIDDYRKTRYRDFSYFAGPTLGVGLLVSAICAVCSLNFPTEANQLRIAAITSLVISTAIWWLLTSLQKSLRRRINPNATFPNFPQLPVGTPVALIQEIDPQTGESHLVPTAQISAAIDDAGPDLWVLFTAGQIYFPSFCCVCMCNATHVYKSPLKMDQTSDVAVPLCRRCAFRITIRWWLAALLLLISIAAVCTLLALTLTFLDAFGRGFLFGIIGLFGAVICLATIPAALTRPYRFKYLDRPRGIMKLSTANPHFTRLLIQQVEGE